MARNLGIHFMGGFVEPVDYCTTRRAERTFREFKKLLSFRLSTLRTRDSPNRSSLPGHSNLELEKYKAIEQRLAALLPDVFQYARQLGVDMRLERHPRAGAPESLEELGILALLRDTSANQDLLQSGMIMNKIDECVHAARMAKRAALWRLVLPWHWSTD